MTWLVSKILTILFFIWAFSSVRGCIVGCFTPKPTLPPVDEALRIENAKCKQWTKVTPLTKSERFLAGISKGARSVLKPNSEELITCELTVVNLTDFRIDFVEVTVLDKERKTYKEGSFPFEEDADERIGLPEEEGGFFPPNSRTRVKEKRLFTPKIFENPKEAKGIQFKLKNYALFTG